MEGKEVAATETATKAATAMATKVPYTPAVVEGVDGASHRIHHDLASIGDHALHGMAHHMVGYTSELGVCHGQ